MDDQDLRILAFRLSTLVVREKSTKIIQSNINYGERQKLYSGYGTINSKLTLIIAEPLYPSHLYWPKDTRMVPWDLVFLEI